MRTKSLSRSARPRTLPNARHAKKRDASSAKRWRSPKRAMDKVTAELDGLLRTIPNLTHPAAPLGMEPVEVARGKAPLPEFAFQAKDHVEIGQRLDLMDFEAAAKVTGHGFYFLKNEAVLLELALQHYAIRTLPRGRFHAHDHARPGAQQSSRRDRVHSSRAGDADLQRRGERSQSRGDGRDHAGWHAGRAGPRGRRTAAEVLRHQSLFPDRGGRHGHATRGLFRVHQFTKVEMFAFTLPDQSEPMLEQIRGIECRIFDGLGIPYRVINTPSGDLGGPAYRKYDLEAWMPGRGEYGEITSASNCTDYQARRLGIRYRIQGEKGTHFVHTLNGTAIAISRALVAILENYQQADGSVVVPEVLRPVVGKERIEVRRQPRSDSGQ